MESNRKFWNEQQQRLRQALENCQPEAIPLFLAHHAMLHAPEVSQLDVYSFDDELWQGLDEATARRIPHNEEHSIVWCIGHLARIEDVTMSLLLAGSDQLFERDGWAARLKADFRDTGNAMSSAEIAALSEAVDIEILRAYRMAVGHRTREIVSQLQPGDFKRKVEPARLQRVLDEGAVCDASRGLLDYWGGLTFAGLLLMPPTRHNLVHLNEAIRLKHKR
jgi:hypothetical protein